MSSAFVTPGLPLKSSCASYPAQADVFFYAQGKTSKTKVIPVLMQPCPDSCVHRIRQEDRSGQEEV